MSSSIFGSPSGSIFGSPSGSIFGSPSGSIFGSPSGSIFGSPSGSIFGSPSGDSLAASQLQLDDSAPSSQPGSPDALTERLSDPFAASEHSPPATPAATFQDKTKAYTKSFVLRWLNNVNDGFQVYEENAASEYKHYHDLHEVRHDLFSSWCKFRDCERLDAAAVRGSPLFAHDFKQWLSLLRSPVRSGASQRVAKIRARCWALIAELQDVKGALLGVKEIWEIEDPATTENVFDRDVVAIEFPGPKEVHLLMQVVERLSQEFIGVTRNGDGTPFQLE
ncbi:hypothetical protein FN846DRAFT_920906 [Sphaerosporella brunnea]|uniref:Uncharacterized protein n=1 Tax=Sphaerosporella brunnea TaxID=1250544 RepID=A0A5J5EQ59_9PEZI|nr:hypothetical protein FN846DRAFT_920906 [Sphaerosporella brunnea]